MKRRYLANGRHKDEILIISIKQSSLDTDFIIEIGALRG